MDQQAVTLPETLDHPSERGRTRFARCHKLVSRLCSKDHSKAKYSVSGGRSNARFRMNLNAVVAFAGYNGLDTAFIVTPF